MWVSFFRCLSNISFYDFSHHYNSASLLFICICFEFPVYNLILLYTLLIRWLLQNIHSRMKTVMNRPFGGINSGQNVLHACETQYLQMSAYERGFYLWEAITRLQNIRLACF